MITNTYANFSVQIDDISFNVLSLITLKITKTINDHARIHLFGKISESEKGRYIKMAYGEPTLRVDNIYPHSSTSPKTLFYGIITRFDIRPNEQKDAYYIEVEGASLTHLLDINFKRRSFQNKKMTYQQMLDLIKSDYTEDCLIELTVKNEELKNLIVQYDETDWNFLQRMASRFLTGLVADAATNIPGFTFGLPNGEDRGNMSEFDPQYTVKYNFGDYLKYEANYSKDVVEQDFTYFELWTPEFFDVGDTLNIDHIPLVVSHSIAFLEESGLLKYRCTAAPRNGLNQPKRYNPRLMGLSLEGNVLEVGGDSEFKDHVTVHLDIDIEQNEDEAAWFPCSTPYSANGHTGWYIMPEPIDRVCLYFPTEDESDAYIITSVRRGEQETKRIEDPDAKYFRTVHRNEMAFYPKDMHIAGANPTLYICFKDSEGIGMSSHNKTVIEADGDISIGSKKRVIIDAKTGIGLKYQDKEECAILMDETKIIHAGLVEKWMGISKADAIAKLKALKHFVNLNFPGNDLPFVAAITNFQRANGLPLTGELDEETKRKLAEEDVHCHRHEDFLEELEKFPAEYHEPLTKLHENHIEWRFKAYNFELSLESVVELQYALNNPVPKHDVNYKEGDKDIIGNRVNSIRQSLKDTVVTIKRDNVKDKVKVKVSEMKDDEIEQYYLVDDNFFMATTAGLKHYCNPLKFLDEKYVYQFMKLKFDGRIHTLDLVKDMLKGTYFSKDIENYANWFFNYSKDNNINPFFLVAKALVEAEAHKIDSDYKLLIGVAVKNETYYNFFGIGAGDGNAIENGTNHAVKKGWNSPEKAIKGGAEFIAGSYIQKGQNTLYTLRYNLPGYKGTKKFEHQYASNIGDAAVKSGRMADALSYLKDKEVEFIIPVLGSGKEAIVAGKDGDEEFYYPLGGEMEIRGLDDQGGGWFGARRAGGARDPHSGIDLLGEIGDPVYAAFDGTVWSGYQKKLSGWFITLIDKQGRRFSYCHLDKVIVEKGTVKAGQLIGTMGKSGNAKDTRVHLHFGVKVNDKPVDPATVFPAFTHPMSKKLVPNKNTPVPDLKVII